jgi:SH3-like domain-containing protein
MAISTDYKIKYITDETGKPQEIIIPFQAWKRINEELETLREKQRILAGLQQACQEVKMQENGELPEQSLEDFLNEL